MSEFPFLTELLERFNQHSSESRFTIGIAGPPASGKSTVCQRLCRDLNDLLGSGTANFLAMDAYHYNNDHLLRDNLYDHKGAHFTFDCRRYKEKLMQLISGTADIQCPKYDRNLSENPIEKAYFINKRTRIIVTEGNYLYLDIDPWKGISELLDYKIFLDINADIQYQRLMDRHLKIQKTRVKARAKIERTDLPNSKIIMESRQAADVFYTPKIS